MHEHFYRCTIGKESFSNFKVLTWLSNVVNAIDGTHIHLTNCLNHKMTLTIGDFFNRKTYA